jgi:hypothetical protein
LGKSQSFWFWLPEMPLKNKSKEMEKRAEFSVGRLVFVVVVVGIER